MDVQAHLLSQGWLGPGHALDARVRSPHSVHEATREKLLNYNHKGHRGLAYDPTSSSSQITAGNGLTKPLLVSQRKTRFGIGKKAHEPPSGTEWWLKGFAVALNNIGKSESERSSGASTPTGTGGKHSGLYGYFIKGQMMQGTILDEGRVSKKRKSDVLTADDDLAVKPVNKSKTAKDLEDSVEYFAAIDTPRKKMHKSGRSTDMQTFEAANLFFDAADEKHARKKARRIEADDSGTTTEADAETKDQRRERRRRRKEKESAEPNSKTLAQMVEEELAKLDSEEPQEDQVVKAARRAERKKRKALEATNGARK